jgi:hypothetical protein
MRQILIGIDSGTQSNVITVRDGKSSANTPTGNSSSASRVVF